MTEYHELNFELLPRPPFSPDLAPTDYNYLFINVKNMLAVKRYDSDKEVIDETEEYSEGLDKTFYNKNIEMIDGAGMITSL